MDGARPFRRRGRTYPGLYGQCPSCRTNLPPSRAHGPTSPRCCAHRTPCTSADHPPPAPTPTPSPPSIPPTPPPTPEAIQALVCAYPWDCATALRVMWCESGGRPTSVGRGRNYGLFQMNAIHARHISDFWTSWMDPARNSQWAYELWTRQGWRPWGCRPR